MTAWLIDTGPLVAYVDRADPAHQVVADCLDVFLGRFHTTGAVITEAMHLVADHPDGPGVLTEFLVATDTVIVDATRPADLRAAVALMKKYADTPMDYADATIVLLGATLNISDVLTLDRRGFATYRTPRGRAFRLVLDGRR